MYQKSIALVVNFNPKNVGIIFSNEKKLTGLDLNVCAIFSRASTEMLS